MSARVDHAAEAVRSLGMIRGVDEVTNQITLAIDAQVHATLALVEEQRTANFIAYAQLLEMQYAEAAKHGTEFDWETREASNARHGVALDRIREGLGL